MIGDRSLFVACVGAALLLGCGTSPPRPVPAAGRNQDPAPTGGGAAGSGGSGGTAGGAGGSAGAGGAAGAGGRPSPTPDAGRTDAAPSAGDAATADGPGGAREDAGAADRPRPLEAGALGPAAAIHGQRWEVPCGKSLQAEQTCENFPPGSTSCPAGGYYDLNKTVTFGGSPGTIYNVTVRIRGVVEPKPYTGGMCDGMHFCVGGTPSAGGEPGVYNTYGINVSSPKQDYWLNHDEGKGVGHYV